MASVTGAGLKLGAVAIVALLIGAGIGYLLGTTTQATKVQPVETQPPSAAEVSIVVSVFGGPIGEFFEKSGILKEFERRNNAKVTLEINTGAAIRTKVLTQKDTPQHDVVLWDATDAILAKDQGLIIELLEKDISGLAKVHPRTIVEKVGVSLLPFYVGIAYNTEKISPADAPKGFLDLWDSKWKGKIGISPPIHSFGYTLLIIAAESKGGNITNIEPGFQKMKELKPNVASLSLSVFPLFAALASGEIWITPMDFPSFLSNKERGAPIAFVFPKEGTFLAHSVLSIVAKRPPEKTQMAKKFVNFLLEPIVQALWTGWTFYLPANKETVISPPLAAKGIDPKLLDQLRTLDFRLVAAKTKEWSDRFTAAWG